MVTHIWEHHRRSDGDQLDGSCEKRSVTYSPGGTGNPACNKTRKKSKWGNHTLHRNCLLKHVIEGKIEWRGRRRRRRKQLVDETTERKRYWKLKEEALDRAVWKPWLRKGYGSAAIQTTL